MWNLNVFADNEIWFEKVLLVFSKNVITIIHNNYTKRSLNRCLVSSYFWKNNYEYLHLLFYFI